MRDFWQVHWQENSGAREWRVGLFLDKTMSWALAKDIGGDSSEVVMGWQLVNKSR